MTRCAHCGAVGFMVAGTADDQCLKCGERTNADGTPVAPTPKFYVEGIPGLPDSVKEEDGTPDTSAA